MFYENQPVESREQYKEMLKILGSLTLLFSENESPYLSYRAHENSFCRFFEAENLARLDCSADAKKDNSGNVAIITTIDIKQQISLQFGLLNGWQKAKNRL